MIVSFHLITFLVNEYFTPEWQRDVRDITREVVEAFDQDFRSRIPLGFS